MFCSRKNTNNNCWILFGKAKSDKKELFFIRITLDNVRSVLVIIRISVGILSDKVGISSEIVGDVSVF